MAETDKVLENERRVENNEATAEQIYDNAVGAEEKTDVKAMLEAMSQAPASTPSAPQKVASVSKPKTRGTDVGAMLSEMASEPEVVPTVPPKKPSVTPPVENIPRQQTVSAPAKTDEESIDEIRQRYQPELYADGGGKDITSGDVIDEDGNIIKQKGNGEYRDIRTKDKDGVEYVTRQYIQNGIITRQLTARLNDKGEFEWLEGSEFDRTNTHDPEKDTYYPTVSGRLLIDSDKGVYNLVANRKMAKEIWNKDMSDIDAPDTARYEGMSKDALVREWNSLADAYDRGEATNSDLKRARAIWYELFAQEGGFGTASEMNKRVGDKNFFEYENWVRRNYGNEIDYYLEHSANDYNNPLRLNIDRFANVLDLTNGSHSVTYYRNKLLDTPQVKAQYMSWALAYAREHNISYNEAIRKGVDDFAVYLDDKIVKGIQQMYGLDNGFKLFLGNMAANNSIGGIVRGIAYSPEFNSYFDRAISDAMDSQPAWAQALVSVGPLIPELAVMWAGGEVVNYGLKGVVGARAAAMAARAGQTLTKAEKAEAFMRFMATGTGRAVSSSLNFAILNEVGAISADVKNREFNPMSHVTAVGRGLIMGALMSGSGAAVNKILPTYSNKLTKYFNNTMRFLAEGGTFAGAEIAELAINGNIGKDGKDKGLSWDDIGMVALNNGAMVLFFKGTHLLHGKNPLLKKSSKDSVGELADKGYTHLAEEIKRRDALINSGKEVEPLSYEARQELEQLNKDMGAAGKGVSWEAYSDALRANGVLLTKGAEMVGTQVREVEGGYRVEGLDVTNRVIKGKFFKTQKQAEAYSEKLRKEISLAGEIMNEASYATERERYGLEAAARSVADSRNEGQQPFLEGGADNPEYTGVTAAEILYDYREAVNTPADKRTPEQTSLIADFELAKRDALKGNKSTDDLKKMICEQYGVSAAEFDVVSEKAPSDRRKGTPATKAVEAYHDLLSKGFRNINEEPIGKAKLNDGSGRELDVLNEVEVNEANLPNDITANIYYRDADGSVQVISASKIGEITYDEGKMAERNAGRIKDELSENNRERKYNEALEAAKSEYRKTLSGLSDEDLERWHTELTQEIEKASDKDLEGIETSKMSLELIDEEIASRKQGEQAEEQVQEPIESQGIKVDPNTGEVTEGEISSAPAADGVIKVGDDGTVIEPESKQSQPANGEITDKPQQGEQELKPKVEEAQEDNSQPKDKIDELLDAMGTTNEKDRAVDRKYYSENPDKFEADYNEFVGKKAPQEQEPVPAEKKSEPVDDSQQEQKIVDDLNAPMPTKEVNGKPQVDYSRATPKRTHKYLYEERGYEKDRVDKIVEKTIKDAKEAVKKHLKKEPQEPNANPEALDAYDKAMKEWEQEKARLEAEQKYWEEVQDVEEGNNIMAKLDNPPGDRREADRFFQHLLRRFRGDKEIEDILVNRWEPRSLEEEIITTLAHNDLKLVWDDEKHKGLKQETGWKHGEQKSMLHMLSKDGTTVQRLSEKIAAEYADGKYRERQPEVRDMIMEVLQSAPSKAQLKRIIDGWKYREVADILRKRKEGQGSYDEMADRRAEEEYNTFVEEHRDELPENFTREDVFALMDKKRQEQEDFPVGEQGVSDENGVGDDIFEGGGEDEYVPFRDGEGDAGEVLSDEEKKSSRVENNRKDDVSLQNENILDNGRQTERNSSKQRNEGDGLRGEPARGTQGSSNTSNTELLAEGVRTERPGDNEGGTRHQQEEAGNQIIENAKANGLFFPEEQIKEFGEKINSPSGESTVYINEAEGKVYKVKDPFAKYPMKGHAMSDVLYEHELHNLLFPNTAYTLMGVSEDLGDVRFVLSQDYISKGFQPATQKQIDDYLLKRLKLEKEDKYTYGNEDFSITDVSAGGDNVLVGNNGELYFIDPIIKFKKPAKEVIERVRNKSQEEVGELFRDGESPTFYSNAERAVENIKQNKATAEQWLAMIKKNGGLKAGEDKWMGLSQWLEENKGKSLTKEEVQQFIADNGIEMEETHYSEELTASQNEKLNALNREFEIIKDNEIDEMYEAADEEYGEFLDEMREKYGEDWEYKLNDQEVAREVVLLDNRERYNQDSDDFDIDKAAFDIMRRRYGDDFASAFEVYEGDLYPIIDVYGDRSLNDVAAHYLGDEGQNINSTRLNYTTEGLDNKREIAFKLPNVEPYQEHDEIHFGPENQGKAVMWVRFGETTDADGKRVLVIDEIQSNRHQDAREKGYESDWVNVVRKVSDATGFSYQQIDDDPYDVANWMDFHAKGEEGRALAKQLRDAVDKKYSAVPNAPFEKNWHEVAMKRMLKLAAEEGFDKVAWTTGEQQAERYSLDRIYNSIEREDNPSIGGKRFVLNGANMDTFVVNNEGVIEDSTFTEFNGKPLKDVVGKDLADKMMSIKDGDILEGEDLRIGGEGMRAFYDGMLPNFMDRYGKRWGVKTGTVELPNVEGAGRTMHSVDVTPEMKESVMQGQPLFRQKEPLGERGVKKVEVLSEPVVEDIEGYDGVVRQRETKPGQYKVEGYDDVFSSVEEAADALRKRMPDYMVYVDENGNIGYEAWSNILPEGTKPNTFAKMIALQGGKISAAMKKRIERYTKREMDYARERAESLSKELGLDIEFHDDPSEFEGRKQKAKGWYDPKTGKIHIVMGNHSGVGDVMATMLHEGVAHHGLRKLFGSDFDTFLDNVHNNVGKEIRADIDARIEKMRAADKGAHSDDYYRRAATEEYIAALAEDGLYNGEKNSSAMAKAWRYIKEKILELIRGKGFNMELSDDDLRYILWSSHKNLRRGAEAKAEDAIMREKAGIKDYVEDGEPVKNVAERGEQKNLSPEKESPASLGRAREMSDADLLEEIGKDRYEVRSTYTDEYDRRHKREHRETYDSTTKMLEEGNTTLEQVGDMLIDAAYDLRDKYTSKERATAKARFEAIQDYYFYKEAEIDKARDDFFTEHEQELKERFGDYYDEEENVDKLMAEYGMAVGEPRVPYRAAAEARKILTEDIRFREGDEEPAPRDFDAERRELMRRRLRGEDVTAELEQLRADRRAAEAARNAGSNGAGSGEPPVEPPAPPAPATPEPAPELPPTGYERPMSPIEMAQEAAIKAVADTKASLEQRNAARRELDASLKNLHKAMRLQKEYDRTTVENVVSLCKMMVKEGLIDRRYISNLTPLFTKLKDATGKEDLTSTVNGIMDVMLKSQERSIRNELNTLLNTKAQKINQSGVVTQGGVDIRGQRTLQSLNENFGKSVEDIDRRITQLEDLRGRIPENSEERLNEVDDKIQGALLAKQYVETAKNHENNITDAEEELAEIKAQYKDGELGLKEYTEQKHALESQIRSYRMSHADAMWNYVKTMHGIVAEGRSRAKDFLEAQKAHKNEIRHNAYSDMAGTSQYTQSRPGSLAKAVNSSASQFLSSSLFTLDTMLRQLGHKHANGEGYLYERFGRGWLDARDNEIRDYWADREELDKKAQELFGVKHFANLIDTIRKMPKMDVPYKDGGDIVNHTLDQAQLMYIYMVNKMEDGIVKLRRMGISEEDVETIKNFMNPKLVELADWLQKDFLPSRREGYNEVHRRMFGADMDMVENYVPLRIDKGNITETVDINNGQNEPSLASTVTGGIIKRTHNTTPIDIMGTNAIDMILGHLDEMNHWKNFAEWNRDVNTLLSDKTFRNKVKNTTTIYGSGDKLWKHLKDVFFIAGGTYKPKGEGIDKAMVNIAKGVSAAKVSFRMFTATKQLLSLPVFAANCNVGYMVKNMAKPAGSWNWCMENLPSFKQRWKSRIAGDTRLEDTDIDWQYTHKKWVEKASKWGLSPNAFVDAMTVAVGARSVYEQRYKRYRKDGYDEAAADRRAKQDATAAFNQTQQSSEKMFVAPMQVDRTALAVGASLFRNASMGYERQFVEGLRNLKHLMGKERVVDENGNVSVVSYKKASIDFMKKQMVRNGLTETQAEAAAKRIYNRSMWRNALKMAMFGFGAQMAWNIGGKLPYLVAQGYNAIFGDDDERKQAGVNAWDTTKEAWWHALSGGWLEGLPFGNVVSDGINNELNDENFFKFSPDLLPIFGDTEDVANHFDSKNKLRGASDLVNLGAQIFIGVNPQSFLDIMAGIVDVTAGKKQSEADFGTAKEALLLTMRIMQCPQSQLDQLYIDELGMSAKQARGLTPEQVARRYAFYKAHHDVPMLWHLYNQEKQDEIVKQYETNFNKKLNDDVKEAGGTPEDYHALGESAESKKEVEKYRKKEIDGLSAQGPEALMKAWEKERDKGAAADYKYMKSLITRYQKDVYGKEKAPDDVDEAYEAVHGEDIKETAQKVGRDLGFNAQDLFFQTTKTRSDNLKGKNKVMEKFDEYGGSFQFSKKGKPLALGEDPIKYPVKDKEKRRKCLDLIDKNFDEIRRIYRNRWRYNRVGKLYEKIDEAKEKAAANKEFDRRAFMDEVKPYFKEVLSILNDEQEEQKDYEKSKAAKAGTKK